LTCIQIESAIDGAELSASYAVAQLLFEMSAIIARNTGSVDLRNELAAYPLLERRASVGPHSRLTNPLIRGHWHLHCLIQRPD
jgi:hypothetical protein